jgi:hypothetical protein
MSQIRSVALRLLVLAHLALPVQGAVVSPVYTQDFEGYSHNQTTTDFSENNDGAFIVMDDVGGDLAFRGRILGSINAAAWVSVPGSESQNFTIATVARVSEADRNNLMFSLGLGVNTTNVTSISNWAYRVNVTPLTGLVSLTRNNFGTVALTTVSGNPIMTAGVGTIYTLTMTGTYTTPTSVTINVTVNDGTNTFQGTYTDNSAMTGNAFGYRLDRPGDGVIGVYFDNFSLQTVPEPSTSVFGVLAGAALLSLRRRKP